MTGELNYPNGILVHQYSIKSGNLNSKQKKIACVENILRSWKSIVRVFIPLRILDQMGPLDSQLFSRGSKIR